MRFVLLIALSCLFGYASLADEIRGFIHSVHLDEGAGCTDCHQLDKATDRQNVPVAVCADCHDEEIPKYKAASSPRPGTVRFPHAAHADSLECNDCHAPKKGFSEPVRGKLSYKACTECHNDADVEVNNAACASCHGVKMRLTAPPDHKSAWLVKHGRESEWRVFEKHGRKCSLCHQSDACITCHQSQKPASHTGLWRIRTHDTAATWDRNGCKTCHETGVCIQCHVTTPPINHTGSFQGSMHALVAQTVGNERCAVCHSLARPCSGCHAGAR